MILTWIERIDFLAHLKAVERVRKKWKAKAGEMHQRACMLDLNYPIYLAAYRTILIRKRFPVYKGPEICQRELETIKEEVHIYKQAWNAIASYNL